MAERRYQCKKFDTYRWNGQVDVTLYYNRPENRFEAEIDGRDFYSSDIKDLKKQIDAFLGDIDNSEWKLFIIPGRHCGYNYNLVYKADGKETVRSARFVGGEIDSIKNRRMPEIGPIRKYIKFDESAIPFTWEYLEAARLLKRGLNYLSGCIEAISDSKNQQKLLDAVLADRIEIIASPIQVTREWTDDDVDLRIMLEEMFEEVEDEEDED